VRSFLIPIGVAVVGLLAGAAVAGRPTTVAHDVPIGQVPAAALTTTTIAPPPTDGPSTLTTTTPPVVAPVVATTTAPPTP
jgi:hypothetical protein